MNQILADMFRHNLWANERLLETCAGLSQDRLDSTGSGAYGSIAATLTHLVGAEQRYLSYLSQQPIEHPVREADGFPGMETLQAEARRSGEGLIRVAEQAEPGQMAVRHRDGVTAEIPAEILLIQAINHATEHRTNITTIMAQQGLETPELDGWSYRQAFEATRSR